MRVMRRYGANTVIAAFIVAVAVVWLIPVVVVVLAGLKSQEDYSSSGLFDLPTEIAWSNFEMFFGGINILQKVGNSFIISGGALLVSIVIAFPVAFAVSVGRHRLRKVVIAVSVLIFLLPLESVAYPIYLFAKMIGMYGNIIFLIIPLGIFGSAFAIFLFANVMNHIPRELAEAAEIDGATRFQLMTRVIIPLMWPTVLTVALLLFVTNWNEYLLTLLLLPDSATQTVPLAVSAVNFGQFGGAPGQLIAAASALAALPSLLVFFIFQRALVRGITAGLQ
jgi:raffinose/stachyose/melibiose transport system permease protein